MKTTTTRERWDHLIELVLETERVRYESAVGGENGEAGAGAVFVAICRRDPRTLQRYDKSTALVLLGEFQDHHGDRGKRAKKRFDTQCKALLIAGDAEGAVFSTEAWVKEMEGEPHVPDGFVEDMPGAVERVIVLIEHYEFGRDMRCADIEQLPGAPYRDVARRRLSEWRPPGNPVVGAEGLFTSLLPPPGWRERADAMIIESLMSLYISDTVAPLA